MTDATGGGRGAMGQKAVQRSLEVEETSDTVYLVIPPSSQAEAQGGELSDGDLESVAGGAGSTRDVSASGKFRPLKVGKRRDLTVISSRPR